MSSSLDRNPTRDETNWTPATQSSNFVTHSYDYRLNWTPLSPVTITNSLNGVVTIIYGNTLLSCNVA